MSQTPAADARPHVSAARMPQPLIIAHRGASGYRPEHTVAAYELAARMGADYIEPDLVPTKDGVLVDRHEPEISGTTDVASRPEFRERKRTLTIDGVPMTGWFSQDFTLGELKSLRAIERVPFRTESATYNGLFEVPTYEELLRLRADLSVKMGRTIGIIPEIKHSTYFASIGLPMEAKVVAQTDAFGLNHPDAPMWVQSFELTNLHALKATHGYRARTTFLTAPGHFPADLIAAEPGRAQPDLLSTASLRQLATLADAISPHKHQVIGCDSAGALGSPTGLVAQAHRAGLLVIPWTFRRENFFLPTDLRIGEAAADCGEAVREIIRYLDAGIDGFFTDHPDIGWQAREQWRRAQTKG